MDKANGGKDLTHTLKQRARQAAGGRFLRLRYQNLLDRHSTQVHSTINDTKTKQMPQSTDADLYATTVQYQSSVSYQSQTEWEAAVGDFYERKV